MYIYAYIYACKAATINNRYVCVSTYIPLILSIPLFFRLYLSNFHETSFQRNREIVVNFFRLTIVILLKAFNFPSTKVTLKIVINRKQILRP